MVGYLKACLLTYSSIYNRVHWLIDIENAFALFTPEVVVGLNIGVKPAQRASQIQF
jgi:hypothetical protein